MDLDEAMAALRDVVRVPVLYNRVVVEARAARALLAELDRLRALTPGDECPVCGGEV